MLEKILIFLNISISLLDKNLLLELIFEAIIPQQIYYLTMNLMLQHTFTDHT